MVAKTKAPSLPREGGHVLEMQRRRLLLAYSEVLADHGLQGASVDRICKRAGVSRRTFYDLFLDREGCFLAALDLALERIAAEVVPAYASTEDDRATRRARGVHDAGRARGSRAARGWHTRLRAGLTALLELFDSDSALARMCVVETLKGGPEILAWRRARIGTIIAAIDEGRLTKSASIGARKRESIGAPPPLTAEGVAGGILSVIHTRLLEPSSEPLVTLVNPLMSMIVHPYLGPAAARRELEHPVPSPAPARNGHAPARVQDPFKDLPIRITFRTARVLATIAASPDASNREIGDAAGIHDQGQISKLLGRLAGHGLIENHSKGHLDGEPNAWTLTERGQAIQHAIEPSALTPAAAGARRSAPA